MTEPVDTQAIKEQRRQDWDRAAANWRKYDERLRNDSAPLTRRLLALAGLRAGHRVLDIGSGSGEPGLPAAEIAGPSGFVLLTDQSPEMLAVARGKASAAGLQNIGFQVSDAEQLQVEAASFDVVLSRGAIEQFPDPVRVLRLAYDALKPGGRIVVSANGRPEANTYFTVPYIVLLKYATLPKGDPTARDNFAFAKPERLRSALAEAGFRELAVEALPYPAWQMGSGREYWEYIRQFSLAGSLLDQIPADQHDKIGEEIAAAAAGGDPDGQVQLAMEAVLATGVK